MVSGLGGAIHNAGALTVTGTTFSGNQASSGGAISAFFHSRGKTISNSTFSGNGANESGGALLMVGGTGGLTVTNSTFASNSAPNGSSVNVQSADVTFTNNVLAIGPTGANCSVASGTVTDGGGNLSFGDASCPGISLDPKLRAARGQRPRCDRHNGPP